MSEEPAGQLLHLLLDAYEHRADPRARAISVSAARLPGYLDERDPAPRLHAHARLQAWEQAGWVRLRWVRGEEGNLLDRVALCAEATAQVYAYLGRIPAEAQQAAFTALLAQHRSRLGPDLPLLAELEARLAAGRSVAPFQLADAQRNEDLLRALAELASLDGEVPERDFSARVLGDSKRLSMLKPALLRLLRRVRPELAGLPDEEAWAALGILPNPGHIYLHGPLTLQLGGSIVEVSAFRPDVGLPVGALSQFEVIALRARYVLTIENRTPYYDYLAALPGDGLILYLGGFPNRARRLVLQRLAEAAPATPLYHWGDLDYGGFAILAHLRRTLGCPVHPHRMDRAVLAQHAAAGRPLSRADRHHLQRLLHDSTLADCHGVIQALLDRGIKLEQELVAPVAPA